MPQRDAAGRISVGADGQPVLTANDGNPRWVGSGWTVFNNKGKPVRQYEPFFSDSHRFELEVRIGVSPVLFYDPAERVITTLHPNHTYEKVVFDPWRQTTWDVNDTCAARNAQTGDPRTDPDIGGVVANYFKTQPPTWQTWHAQRIGSALGADERNAAERAAAHADTPTTAHFDALGRPFLTVARNRVVCPGHDLNGTEESFATRVELDIEGNQRVVRDAIQQAGDPLGRVVMRYAYDMLGNRIHQRSMEAGARWMLNDVAGKPIRAWDSRGHNFATKYDALRRPVEQTVRGTFSDADPLKPNSDPRTLNRNILVDKIEYGEPPLGAAPAEETEAQRLNLRTRIYRHADSAGIATNARLDASGNPVEAYDFKGNLLSSTRQLVSDYTAIPDWLLNPQLDAETFEGSTRYDALNRPIQSIAPHSSLTRPGHPNKFNVIQPVFNEANLLERVDVWLERPAEPPALLDPADLNDPPSPVGVADIDYDAKGQRRRIDYKNGASTSYSYDPLTFRLTRLLTRRRNADFPGDDPQPPDAAWPGNQVQNLHYTYDPAGNITHIRDDAQQTVYFRNQRVEPSNDYVYDALYRLIQADGREHLGQAASGERLAPTAPDGFNAFHTRLDHPGDGNAMGNYTERYVYDAVGNFLQMQHRGSDPAHPGWTRAYTYAEASLTEPGKQSNSLSSTQVGNGIAAVPETYLHDAHGNMLRMAHLGGGGAGPNMHWDYKDQLGQSDQGGGGTAFYVHDASGQRVRKVWEKAPGLTEERIYLGGFEIFRRHDGPIGANTATLERETLHVMDDKQRIALVETRTLDSAGNDQAPRQLIRYQFGNHLGSANLELDERAQIISYEEYAPYGSSTYQAVRSQTETAKRYRYSGKEQDEESGLYYHGARNLCAWLGRWTRSDPLGLKDGVNAYAFVRANPIRLVDPSGTQSQAPDEMSPEVRAAWDAAERANYDDASVTALVQAQDRDFERRGLPLATRQALLERATVRATTSVRQWDQGNYGSAVVQGGAGVVESLGIGFGMFGDSLRGTAARMASFAAAPTLLRRGLGRLGGFLSRRGARTPTPEPPATQPAAPAAPPAAPVAPPAAPAAPPAAPPAPPAVGRAPAAVPPAPPAPIIPATAEAVEQLLVRSEAAGGHLVERHVGETAAALAERLVREPRIPAASTFNSFTEAVAAVGGALRANAGRIANWVAGGARGRLPLDAPFAGGSVLTRGATATSAGTGVRVVLQGNGAGGWHVLTGFPTP